MRQVSGRRLDIVGFMLFSSFAPIAPGRQDQRHEIRQGLAEHEDGNYIPLKEIAARQQISKKYLEILVKELVKGGFVVGASGKGGGYKLCRKPEDYYVGEIIELMEGPLATVACLLPEAKECPRAASCQTLPMWEEYDKLVHDFFYSRKLSDLVEESKRGKK